MLTLNRQIKSLRKELQSLNERKVNDIYLVNLHDNYYTVRQNGYDVVFKGDREAYEMFTQKHKDSTFIIMRIPRPTYTKISLIDE